MFRNIAFLVLATIMIVTLTPVMAAPVIPAGTEVTLTYQSGDQVLCRVGQEEGLFYPIDPASPANYATCGNSYALKGISIEIAGEAATCTGDAITPIAPSNCSP